MWSIILFFSALLFGVAIGIVVMCWLTNSSQRDACERCVFNADLKKRLNIKV